MKYIIYVIVIFFNCSIVIGQPKDTLQVTGTGTDCIIKIKIEKKCDCGMSFTPYHFGYYYPSEFFTIDVIDIIEKHSGDTIPDELIKKIEYLLTPNNIGLCEDSIYIISGSRGYSYDYLLYENMLHENTVIIPRDLRKSGGGVGLKPRQGDFPYFIKWLFNHRIISPMTALKFARKGEEQKEIEICLKRIKRVMYQ
jgi:hypothetical protein